MRDLFARWADAAAVTPPGNPGNPEVTSRGYRKTSSEINQVTSVTSVTSENKSPRHVRDDQGLTDAYEERAAILEHDAHARRDEAESLAWYDVYGATRSACR